MSISSSVISVVNGTLVDVPPLKSMPQLSAPRPVAAPPAITTQPSTITAIETAKNTFFLPTKSMGFRSFFTPYSFTLCRPMSYKAYSAVLVTNSAVNMDKRIPIASVVANPFTVPEPSRYSTAAAISVVTLPSTIADSALLKPVLIAERTVLPTAISSLIRVKMMTLASTAIPMERMMPAMPGSVSVTSNADSRIISRPTYRASAITEATPGIR